VNKGKAEGIRRELLDERRREEDARLAEADASRNREAVAREARLTFELDGAYFNLPYAQRLMGPGQRLSSGETGDTLGLPVRSVGGVECVRADELEAAFDSGRFGVSQIGRIEVLAIRALSDLDAYTAQRLGFRDPPKGWTTDGKSDLARYFRVGGEQAARIDPVVRERYSGDLASILPCEVGLDNRQDSLLYIRALSAEPDGAALTTGAAAATGPGPGPAPAPAEAVDEE